MLIGLCAKLTNLTLVIEQFQARRVIEVLISIIEHWQLGEVLSLSSFYCLLYFEARQYKLAIRFTEHSDLSETLLSIGIQASYDPFFVY